VTYQQLFDELMKYHQNATFNYDTERDIARFRRTMREAMYCVRELSGGGHPEGFVRASVPYERFAGSTPIGKIKVTKNVLHAKKASERP
jgi:hypothetical protein